MSGVRLHHPSLRSSGPLGTIYTVIHEGSPIMRKGVPTPVRCGGCGQVHVFKTYHLALDQFGDVVVSEFIYERLKEAGLAPLVAQTEVRKPETQHLPLPTIGLNIPDRRLAGTNGRPIRPGKEIYISREGRHR